MSTSAFHRNHSDNKPGDIAQKTNIIKEKFGEVNYRLVYLFTLTNKKCELIKITNSRYSNRSID
jgi:hypothetical protein